MAKKSTVGGPRARRTTAEDIQRRKEYKSRAERERMWQRRTLIITGIIVAVSLILLLGGFLNDEVVTPAQAITTVNGDEVSTRDFQNRVRFIRWQTAQQIRDLYYLVGGDVNTLQQYAGQQISQLNSPVLLGSTVLDEMEEELILAQAAEERGIRVDEAEVEKQVDDYMASSVGLTLPDEETATPTTEPTLTPTPLVSATPSNTPAPTETPTTTPTSTPVEGATAEAAEEVLGTPTMTFTPSLTPTETLTPTPTATLQPGQIEATLNKAADQYYESVEEETDVKREIVRDVFYYQALREAMYEDLTKDMKPEELQVNARHILIAFDPNAQPGQAVPPTEEQKADAKARADQVMAALQAGEPFADLAKAVSNDTGSAAQGGELGWSSPDKYTANFADAVLSEDVQPGEIIGPIETEFGYHIIQLHAREIRPLTPSEFSTKRQEAFQKWLDEQKASAKIERRDQWADRVPDEPTYNELLGDILPQQ